MKLTPEILKKLVLEEVAKLKSDSLKGVEAKEVGADEMGADATLEKKIDYAKALKLKEEKLSKALAAVREERARVVKKILGSV